jgi:scavenger receptor class B, member 1
MACTILAQKLWIVGSAVTLFLISLPLGILWRDFSLTHLLYPELILDNGTMNYENWIETPDSIELYLDVYMFNWTNADQIHNRSVKPHFKEVGPYVFK